MPILEIEMVVDDGQVLNPELAQQLADAAGTVLGTPPGRTWVRLRALPKVHYAENLAAVPGGGLPVFVSVLISRVRGRVKLKTEVETLVGALAHACGRPKENIHVLYLPEAAGRMAFGGELV